MNQIICAFAAASNITGTLVDVNAVTAMCHKYEALVLWDYATAAPYVEINMNPVISGYVFQVQFIYSTSYNCNIP